MTLKTPSWLVYVSAIAAQPLVTLLLWGVTWDDSAITLGFARTFALTGIIAPTPGSAVVEGYSTSLWMLLMAAVAKFDSNPHHLLVVAKMATMLLSMAGIVLTRRFAARTVPEDWARLCAGVLGLQAITFHETLNGMEGPLSLVLLLLAALLYRRADGIGIAGAMVAGSLFILTRWEAAWLLAPFCLALLVSRHFALLSIVVWGTVFLASNLGRWLYFGSVWPNTITAKSGEPYRSNDLVLELARHYEPFQNLVILLLPVLLSLTVALVLVRRRRGRGPILGRGQNMTLPTDLRLAALLSLFGAVLNLAIGQNWGPPNRGFFVVLPFLLLLLTYCLYRLAKHEKAVAGVLPGSLALATVAIAFWHGLALASPHAPDYMPDVTVGNVASLLPALDDVASATGRPNLLFAGPDMGAVMLFGRSVQIVDLGKLSDVRLAHDGYAALCPYLFSEVRPDVIEVHSVWTAASGIAECAALFEDYRVVFVHGLRFFIRQELVAVMEPSALRVGRFDGRGDAAAYDQSQMFYSHQWPEDLTLNRRFGDYAELLPR